MKKIVFFCLIMTVIMSGCTTKQEANSIEQKEKIETKKDVIKLDKEIKTALADFETALVEKDFGKIANFYSTQSLEHLSTSVEELTKDLESEFKEKELEAKKGYEVTFYDDYDKNYKYIELNRKFLTGKEKTESIEKEEWMLVKEEGKWKFDFTHIMSREHLQLKPFILHENNISFSNFVVEKKINGIGINMDLENLSEKKYYKFIPDTKIILHTDKGDFEGPKVEKEFAVNPKGYGPMYVPFKSAEGQIKNITINDILFIDENNQEHKIKIEINLVK